MSPRLALPLVLAFLTAGWAPAAAPSPDDDAVADEAVLRAADLPADGPGLLDLIRKRVILETDRLRVAGLIRKLGDDDFDVRERATADLRAMGPVVRPMLREALNDSDSEVRFRAQRCLASIEQADKPAVLGAAVRTLGRLRPPGTVEALLAASPSFEDQEVLDDVSQALTTSGVRKGRVDPALIQALGDRTPIRRLIAGDVIARAGGPDVRPAVEKLLQDSDAAVRQRVALALLDARDKEAIPALITLLGDTPRDRSWPVEDALRFVAGDQAPSQSPGDDEDSRRKCRDAWEAWWKDHGAALDLTKLDFANRRLGYTLVAEMEIKSTNSRLVEYDSAGKERWQIAGLRYAIDAQMVGSERVLVAEYLTRTVSERNLKGDVLWQYRANNILLGARRLPNGDTFVVTRNQLTVVDKDGKETTTIPRPNDVCAAAKFRDGSIALLTNGGALVHLDASGKELKTLQVGAPVLAIGTNIDALPNGHVLAPLYSSNKVVEFDEDGKAVWEAPVQQPSSVARLPNGHTLVASRIAQLVVEMDRDGKEVRTLKVDGRPFRATQR